MFDALTFWNHGYRNVTCMFGPDALNGDHLAAFEEFNVKRILTTCESVCPRLLEAGLDCFLLRLPAGNDVNSLARQAEDAGQTLSALGRMAFHLDPIAQAIAHHVRAGVAIHADDTTVPVLDPGRGKTKTGRLWVAVRDERPWGSGVPPAVFYRYAPDRKAEQAEALLKGCGSAQTPK